MADAILLNGLRVLAYCGVLPEEIERRQPFELDVVVSIDLARAGSTDDLGDTVDYGSLGVAIADVADRGRFNLLERFAHVVAETVLTGAPLASEVEVTVRKLRPPVTQMLESSGVRVVRRRS